MAAKRNVDPLTMAVSRGFMQALDTLAYERAYEVMVKDPEVQKAIDVLLDKMQAAFRKRRNGNGAAK
jgi:hypothetical protein